MKSTYVKNTKTRGGVGCLPIIGIVFVILKLTHNIDWSWWWVVSPFIAHASILIGLFAILGGLMYAKSKQLL